MRSLFVSILGGHDCISAFLFAGAGRYQPTGSICNVHMSPEGFFASLNIGVALLFSI
jgi:hypothetical protein